MNNNIFNERIEKIQVDIHDTILFTIKKMDTEKKKLLLVFDSKSFYGLISIGDIQRAIINNIDMNVQISEILRDELTYSFENESQQVIEERMLKLRTECMPIINTSGNLVNVIFWEDVFKPSEKRKKNGFDLPIVIMAGGKGSRLQPLTNIIPKPLIPLGDLTIIEEIMNRFVDMGSSLFLLSVNYKADTIKYYFNQLNNDNYKIDYFQEEKPLGTAGSLFLIKDKINTTFFVTNCDIIINEDYTEILKYHKENKNELTIVSALKHFPISYGTIETTNGGVLTKLVEKPELTFQINSGMYILEPHLLNEIPENEFFHITQLIANIQKRDGKVGVFPVSEGSWTDIGEWGEYLKELKI